MLKFARIAPILSLLLFTGTATAREGITFGKIDATRKFNQVTLSPNPTFVELLLEFFYEHALFPIELLLELTTTVLTTTPDVYPNPAVEEVHRQLLIIAIILSTLAFMAAGLLYMVGPLLGISYGQVRLILPRIIIALVFATISLPLLQLTVDFTNALVHAFKPPLLEQSLDQMLGLSIGVLIIAFLQSALLLGVAILMIIRMVYIMFAAAISPLLALMWSLPQVRRYADTFIAGYFAALMIAPLNLLVLKFSLALMDGSGVSTIDINEINTVANNSITTTTRQDGTNWIFGVVSLILLILVPYQVWTASQTIVGQTRRAASNAISKRRNNSEKEDDLQLTDEQKQRLKANQRKRQASIRKKRGKK